MGKINYRALVKALRLIEDDRQIDSDIILEALKDAIAKAYRKHTGISDVKVKVDVDAKGHLSAYHQFEVVEEVDDDELEISLEDARKTNPEIQLGEFVETEIDITEFGRAAALQAKNVMKQKIREAEKLAVYDEYVDKLDEMVFGTVESVEDKFVVVNIGKTLALMPHSAQIPNEHYRDNERLRVIITAVNKETKGAQVLVSRSSDYLVKRLFEKEVPEIYDGVVEIKAIAREAGDRTKMAVLSHDPNVDPIGACIGPKGVRVQAIIDEIKGEKIDIFEWSDNIGDLVSNALAPAKVEAVFYSDDKRSIIVVVEDNQLSLAIGKKGKNARLAVKLTKHKIDIKTISQIEEAGIDLEAKKFELMVEQEKNRRTKSSENIQALEETLATSNVEKPVEETTEVASEITNTTSEAPLEAESKEQATEAIKVEEPVVEKPKRKKRELKPRTEYVSKFEKLAGNSPAAKQKQEQETKRRKYKKDKEEEERRLRAKDLVSHVDKVLKVEYTEEELEEIRRMEQEQNQKSWIQDDDIDFSEYDEYYDDVE